MIRMQFGQIHHLEYYVLDLAATRAFWGWFLSEMGYEPYQNWPNGFSYRHPNGTYICFVLTTDESSSIKNNRQGPGLNHLALQGRNTAHLEQLKLGAIDRGARILFTREGYLCFEELNLLAVEIYCE